MFNLKVEWVPTADNLADGITREKVDNDIILANHIFLSLDSKWGPFSLDIMASSSNAKGIKGGENCLSFLAIMIWVVQQ